MKMTRLICPSCGGRLEPMEGSPQIMVCEYCNSQFVMENDMPTAPQTPLYPKNRPPVLREDPSSGNTARTWAFITLALTGIIIGNIMIFSSRRPASTSVRVQPDAGYETMVPEETPPETAESPLYEEIVKTIFQKDAGLVTETDLARIKYIRIHTGSASTLVEYSFESPYEENPETYAPVQLTLPPLSWDSRDLARFTGLQKIDAREEHISQIPFDSFNDLKGILLSGVSPAEAAELLPAPEAILELSLEHPADLEGIGAFEHLKNFSAEGISAPDLRQLTALKELRILLMEEETEDSFSLSEEEASSLTDYSALSVLTGLEELSITSSAIRDLGFLSPLTGLKSLSISESDAISLEPLRELTQLTSLELEDNSSLQDYAPVESLAHLKTLVLDKGTSQPDPDLSVLTELETLDMSGFMSVRFLERMNNLKELFLHGCNVDEIQALSGLTSLESLTCYSVWTYAVPLRNLNFLDSMTSLKSLDLCGGSTSPGFGSYQHCVEILGDISNAFNHPGLQRLILSNCTFEIDFDRLTGNSSLKYLEMKEIHLKENFYVESYNGMTDIWYDDVSLDAHLDFLTLYPGLEELYLDGNQITGLSFAPALTQLTHLGIQDNYVTDLSPLHQIQGLEYLDIRKNPVSGTVEMGEDILILK